MSGVGRQGKDGLNGLPKDTTKSPIYFPSTSSRSLATSFIAKEKCHLEVEHVTVSLPPILPLNSPFVIEVDIALNPIRNPVQEMGL